MSILRRLGFLPEKPKPQQKVHTMNLPPITDEMVKIPKKFPQFAHQHRSAEDFEEKEEEKKEEPKPIDPEKEAKKKLIGKGNLMELIRDFDRVQLKRGIRNAEVPDNKPRDHFRGDINRIVKMSKEEVDHERGKRYLKNMDEVFDHFNHNKSTGNVSEES